MKNLIAFLVLNLLSLPLSVTADEIKIVALGASQTNGKGVAKSDTYPAQLEKILKAEGYSVSVANEGIDGGTTRDILNRLNRAVPDGTKIVILQPGTNDRMAIKKRASLDPAETRNNVEHLLAELKERNIRTILLGYPGDGGQEIAQKFSAEWYGQPTQDISPEMIQADRQHLTEQGYALLAQKIAPLIKDALVNLLK